MAGASTRRQVLWLGAGAAALAAARQALSSGHSLEGVVPHKPHAVREPAGAVVDVSQPVQEGRRAGVAEASWDLGCRPQGGGCKAGEQVRPSHRRGAGCIRSGGSGGAAPEAPIVRQARASRSEARADMVWASGNAAPRAGEGGGCRAESGDHPSPAAAAGGTGIGGAGAGAQALGIPGQRGRSLRRLRHSLPATAHCRQGWFTVPWALLNTLCGSGCRHWNGPARSGAALSMHRSTHYKLRSELQAAGRPLVSAQREDGTHRTA